MKGDIPTSFTLPFPFIVLDWILFSLFAIYILVAGYLLSKRRGGEFLYGSIFLQALFRGVHLGWWNISRSTVPLVLDCVPTLTFFGTCSLLLFHWAMTRYELGTSRKHLSKVKSSRCCLGASLNALVWLSIVLLEALFRTHNNMIFWKISRGVELGMWTCIIGSCIYLYIKLVPFLKNQFLMTPLVMIFILCLTTRLIQASLCYHYGLEFYLYPLWYTHEALGIMCIFLFREKEKLLIPTPALHDSTGFLISTGKVSKPASRSTIREAEWIPFDEIVLNEDDLIGFGSNGRVYFGLWKNSTDIALKRILSPVDFSDPASLKEFETEIFHLSQLRHPNIILYLGASKAPDSTVYLITEYIPTGSLATRLRNCPLLPIPILLNLIEQVSAGMHYLHSRDPPMLHGDLKPANLLIVGDFEIVKITDFGSSRFLHELMSKIDCIGTLEYLAPEVLINHEIRLKSDVYSMGVIIWQAMTGSEPYAEFLSEVVSNTKKDLIRSTPLVTNEDDLYARDSFLASLTLRCLSKNVEERPDFSDIGTSLRIHLGDRGNTK